MRRLVTGVTLLVGLLLVGCAQSGGGDGFGDGGGPLPWPTAATEPPAGLLPKGGDSRAAPRTGAIPDLEPDSFPGRYRASGLVLEDSSHGPQLCAGGVAASLPPQCGGIDVTPWSWKDTKHESMSGVRWAEFGLVGSYDGKTLTLTEPPGPPSRGPGEPMPDFSSPCPTPAGGWAVVNASRATDEALQAAQAWATEAPNGAGLWIDQNGGENDPERMVVNARFTGDLSQAEAALRRIWGGALCVSPAKLSLAQLQGIQNELSQPPWTLTSGIDVVGNRVTLEVVVATDDVRRRVDAAYGAGTVHLTGFLQPA